MNAEFVVGLVLGSICGLSVAFFGTGSWLMPKVRECAEALCQHQTCAVGNEPRMTESGCLCVQSEKK